MEDTARCVCKMQYLGLVRKTGEDTVGVCMTVFHCAMCFMRQNGVLETVVCVRNSILCLVRHKECLRVVKQTVICNITYDKK